MKLSSLFATSLVLAIAALSVNTASATSCLYAGTFEVFAKQHPIIVRGVVESYGPQLRDNPDISRTLKVTVSETFKGSLPNSTFDFYGDTDMSCLCFIMRLDFPIGGDHFFLLEDDDISQSLMSCNEASVAVLGDPIQGYMIGENEYIVNEMGIEEFVQKVR